MHANTIVSTAGAGAAFDRAPANTCGPATGRLVYGCADAGQRLAARASWHRRCWNGLYSHFSLKRRRKPNKAT
jgi:hypothetical protein